MENRNCNIIIKIGGSLLTTNTSINNEYINSLCAEITKIKLANVILLHGGGSLIKNIFLSYDHESDYLSNRDQNIISSFYNNIDNLNKHFTSSMNKFGLPCFTLPPRFITKSNNGIVDYFNFDFIIYLLNKKIIPVLHGDIIFDDIHDYYACSSDFFVPILAEKFNPYFVIFLTNVDGIYENYPPLINENHLRSINISFLDKMKNKYKAGHSDMFGKLEYAFKCITFTHKCCIINGNIKNNLTNVLNNSEFIGTVLN